MSGVRQSEHLHVFASPLDTGQQLVSRGVKRAADGLCCVPVRVPGRGSRVRGGGGSERSVSCPRCPVYVCTCQETVCVWILTLKSTYLDYSRARYM